MKFIHKLVDFHLQNYFDSYVRYACLSVHIVLFVFAYLSGYKRLLYTLNVHF